MKWISDLIDLIFPRYCAVCGEPLSPQEKDICVNCLNSLPKIEKIHLEEIEKNFNATQFEQGKAELNDEAKFVLHDLAKLMKKNPTLKVQIVGHTSAEGDANLNQKLSEARAQAAVDFLVARGIATERLDAEGKGSSEPLDVNNPEVNRRTEFVVFE